MGKRTIIIDADFIPYKVGGVYDYSPTMTENQALALLDRIVFEILVESKCHRYVAFLSGSKPDFRKKEHSDYKKNRENLTKPSIFPLLRETLKNKFKCYTVLGVEADDIVCSYHQQYNDTVLCSPDKDLLQSPGLHYDLKSKNIKTVSKIGVIKQKIKKNNKKKIYSDGSFKLWHQMISGDPTDNIKGLPRYGDIKAYNILKECKSEAEMKQKVKNEYLKVYGDNYMSEMKKTYCLVKMRHDLLLPPLDDISLPVIKR